MPNQHSLLPYNTFGIDAKAEHLEVISSVEVLQRLLQQGVSPAMILGGGSNILLTRDIAGWTFKNEIRGMRVVRSFAHRVWVEVGGGERWHDFVLWAVENGYGGVENMSLIPGTVGAAPIQNIGAYGVELKDVFLDLQAVSLSDGSLHRFSKKACRFGYRDSIFKQEARGRYFICKVVFSLSRDRHRINTGYGDIQNTLKNNGIEHPTIADVSRAVIQIRSSKLPDPAQIGNCGSFFKNPETERSVLDRILKDYPNAPHFPLADGRVKIPAGWLIEQCGWKGKRVGNTGCYEKQALVLVNYGGATGEEVKRLAYEIIASVEAKFGIRLEAEVNIV